MRANILGTACVTPLGRSTEETVRRLRAGERAALTDVKNPESGRAFSAALVPQEFTAHLAREPRLRRASAISLLAAAAGTAAIAESGVQFSPEKKSRLAVVFGVSSGGVQYTRRFYEQIVKQGANAASPLLFPETVYNAPASHLAAMLGMDGATYTLVGDGTAGMQALEFGAQLIACGSADHALVVAAEELDWILLEAHRAWGLAPSHGCSPLAEGAAAVLLSRDSGNATLTFAEGRTHFSREDARAMMECALADAAEHGAPDVVVSGTNGTWTDAVITKAPSFPNAPTLTPKHALGECLGAGALLQVVLALEELQHSDTRRALVAALGWNQQAVAAVIERTVPGARS